jgi:nitrogen fixation-related uncharacterized protein
MRKVVGFDSHHPLSPSRCGRRVGKQSLNVSGSGMETTDRKGSDRRGRGWLLPALLLILLAVVAAAVALIGLAYIEQSDKVDALEQENERILHDHETIGEAFGEQSKKLAAQEKKLDAAIRASYSAGLEAARRARSVPAALQPLSRYAVAGTLVPRRIPPQLDPRRMRISAEVDGYVIRWRELALFASRTDELSVWTRQALGGLKRTEKLGPRRVTRLVGPSGVIYAWRERSVTYALAAFPALEPAGRSLIASMR